jgi:hypothetical protein
MLRFCWPVVLVGGVVPPVRVAQRRLTGVAAMLAEIAATFAFLKIQACSKSP